MVDDHHWSPGSDEARHLAGKVDAGQLAEAEAVDPVEQARLAEPLPPIVTAPMLLDLARIWRTVMRSVPRCSASWITRSPTRSVGGSTNEVDGVTRPSDSAPATVTSLKIEPGS